jgi:VanZ family protein
MRWVVTIAYAGFIFFLSSRTWKGLPSFPFADKSFHAILYFGFGALLLWSLRATRLKARPFIAYIAFLCAVAYGLSDEIHQLFVPGREFSLFDLMADGAGAAIGVAVATKLAGLVRKKGYSYDNDTQ